MDITLSEKVINRLKESRNGIPGHVPANAEIRSAAEFLLGQASDERSKFPLVVQMLSMPTLVINDALVDQLQKLHSVAAESIERNKPNTSKVEAALRSTDRLFGPLLAVTFMVPLSIALAIQFLPDINLPLKQATGTMFWLLFYLSLGVGLSFTVSVVLLDLPRRKHEIGNDGNASKAALRIFLCGDSTAFQKILVGCYLLSAVIFSYSFAIAVGLALAKEFIIGK